MQKDGVLLRVVAKIGKPTPLGHLGHLVVSAPNARGEMVVEFTVRRKGARKFGMTNKRPLVDRGRRDRQDDLK